MNLSNKPFFTLIGRMFSDRAVTEDACCGTQTDADACCGGATCGDASSSSCCESAADTTPARQPGAPAGGCGCR